MFNTSCRCGKNSMNFKNKVGDFYVDTCCQIAGYDYLGNKVRKVTQEIIEDDFLPEDKIAVESPKKKSYLRKPSKSEENE